MCIHNCKHSVTIAMLHWLNNKGSIFRSKLNALCTTNTNKITIVPLCTLACCTEHNLMKCKYILFLIIMQNDYYYEQSSEDAAKS